MSSSGMGRDVHCLMLSIQHSSADHGVAHLQEALTDGFEEAVLACDMPEPCKFQSFNSCQKRFPRTHKEVDFAPHPVIGLVLQVGDVEKFPQALGFESLDPFLSVTKQGPCFIAIEEMKVTGDLYSLNLLAKLMVLHHQILFSLALAAIAWGNSDADLC